MFIGASPERLFKRDGELLYSEALAATRPRGATLAEDEALGHELMTSDKDLREHKMVLDRIPERAFRIAFQVILTVLALRLIWIAAVD